MHRFHVDTVIEGETLILSDAGQLHHLRDVLRLEPGDEIVIFAGQGEEYFCSIAGYSQQGVEVSVKSRKKAKGGSLDLTVACAIPKKNKMDEIVDKLTQLGVSKVIPMMTERSVVRLDDGSSEERVGRWKRVAKSAAQQSHRSSVLEILSVTDVEKVISGAGDYDLKLIATVIGERRTLAEVLSKAVPRSILVMIGPEGDFSEEEVELAVRAGFAPVTLGDLVLRVETAAVAVASFFALAGLHS